MRRGLVPCIVLALSTLVCAQVWAGREGPGALGGGRADNLLVNPGFEGQFTLRPDPYWGGDAVSELGVAEGWELWYDKDHRCPPYSPGCDPTSYYLRPEYKGEEGTARVRNGSRAQKFFNNYGTHWAGFYQVVEAPPGSWVRFSIWVWTWSSALDVPDYSFSSGDYRVYAGIDPTGGSDWISETIQWGPSTTRHDQWVYLEATAYTESGRVSVWTRGAPVWPVKHNDSYWDDATLVVLGGEPQPTPTPTATRTPYPTPAPTPTGGAPHACAGWQTVWSQSFDDGQMPGWGQDAALGSVAVADGALWLRSGASPSREAPLAWLTRDWPASDDLRISLTFAFAQQTGYGTTIGIGSEAYAGERFLAGSPEVPGIGDILSIHQNSGEFSVRLLGQPAWSGTPGDTTWHTLQLERRENTYIVYLDGVERRRGASYWRPQSLYLGNAVIVTDPGGWTEIGLDNLRLEQCGRGALLLPLLFGRQAAVRPRISSGLLDSP